jgi:hypothetical protein
MWGRSTVFIGAGMMKRVILFLTVCLTVSVTTPAIALSDDIATVGLWQMESIYYDSIDLPWTADDDSQNLGRNHDMILWRSGLNEVPPAVVPGYTNSAFLFDGSQDMIASDIWSSSSTELKVDYMIYIDALPTELGAGQTYLFYAPIFESGVWPSAGADYMRFRVYLSSGNCDGDIVVQNLKQKWLHVVASYDASRNYSFSVTDVATGITSTVTKTGSAALKSASGITNFGSTKAMEGKPVNRNFRGMIDDMKISNKVVTPHYSFNPAPAASSTIYARPDNLSWSKGLVAQRSDVFFGTSSSAVTAAVKPAVDIDGSTFIDFYDYAMLAGQWQQAPGYPSADINSSGLVNGVDLQQLIANWLTSTTTAYPLFLGSTIGNTAVCPVLLPSKTYYWRVDSVNSSENIKGNTWSFTTGSAATSNPYPATGATGVATDANAVNMAWTAGFSATSYDVYFGTQASPPLFTTVSATSLAKSGLAPNTNYYWSVDSISDTGTTTGTIWSFTTGSIGVTTPVPANSATNVTFPLVGVDLTWTSVFKPGAYNVYFGTQASPPYVGTTTQGAFRSPAVVQNKTYYWRVDCVSVFGTVTGTIWSFTTATPAFPQAEGFGRFARGGRGGTIYHVTTLADSGAGSLRDAISVGNRTIVFDVGGYITTTSRLSLTQPNITIAGQTAPGGGIGIAGPGISIGAQNLIMRYVRVRYTSTTPDDSVTVNINCANTIFDHVSASWGIDEVFSVTSSVNVTMQWCMITEGLNYTGHSKGSLLEWPILSLHHSIYAHNIDRNPKNKGTFDYRNNVVYDWGMAPYIAGGGTGGQCYANCVGNYYISGASTTTDPNIMVVGGNSNYHMYFSDNRVDTNRNGVKDGVDLGIAMIDPAAMPVIMPTPYEFPPVATTSPEVAYTRVLANAGCSLVRDSIDTRIIDDITNETGGIITNYTDRGGLGTIAGGTAPLDTDQDGMPDAWEDAHGLSKTNAADGNLDANGDGYTNLEEYLNSLAVYPAP